MNKINDESLHDIFNLPIDDTTPPIDVVNTNDNNDETGYVDTQLKTLLTTANQLLSAASDLISQSLEPESISSAASMVNSVSNIISEINKSVILTFRTNIPININIISYTRNIYTIYENIMR